jgi:DNA polymerase III epsilon subunit-like protein
MRKIFLDTETTGLSPGQIGQLSMIIEEENGEVSGKNYFFKIDYITSGAEQVCGRGLEFYAEASGGKIFADYKDEIYNILKDSTLIAHNLKFDENFISTEFWRQQIMFAPAGRFDTMSYFRDICKLPGGTRGQKYKNPKLEELVDYFNVDKDKVQKYSETLFPSDDSSNVGFHDARYDTTSMFVAFHIYQDSLHNKTDWADVFCKK